MAKELTIWKSNPNRQLDFPCWQKRLLSRFYEKTVKMKGNQVVQYQSSNTICFLVDAVDKIELSLVFNFCSRFACHDGWICLFANSVPCTRGPGALVTFCAGCFGNGLPRGRTSPRFPQEDRPREVRAAREASYTFWVKIITELMRWKLSAVVRTSCTRLGSVYSWIQSQVIKH